MYTKFLKPAAMLLACVLAACAPASPYSDLSVAYAAQARATAPAPTTEQAQLLLELYRLEAAAPAPTWTPTWTPAWGAPAYQTWQPTLHPTLTRCVQQGVWLNCTSRP